jgi:thiamine-monophosphate kinase
MPSANEKWLSEFSEGFFSLAQQFKIQLIGGDMTRAPLSITVGAYGFIPKGLALTRSGAKPGDLIYVSNVLGDGGLALRLLARKIKYSPEQKQAIEHFNRPYPRVTLGEHLRGIAHSAIDISDGLAADLGHILEQSNVGAVINVDQLPLSDAMRHTLTSYEAMDLALTAGDDFELCFTVPPEHKTELERMMQKKGDSLSHIGFITEKPGLVLQFTDGKKYEGPIQGYQHF